MRHRVLARAFVAHLGRRLAHVDEVVELVRERLGVQTADGPSPVETTCTSTDADGGTRVRRRDRGEPPRSARVTAPATAAGGPHVQRLAAAVTA